MLTALLLALQTPAAAPPPPAFAGEPAAVAVRFDRRRIIVVEERGDAERRTHRRVTADDPVRIASISKLVVALGVMRLAEAGRVDLDRDISDYLGWRLRSPHFPDQPITLAHLLGHRSGLTDRIDYLIPLDGDLPAILNDASGWDSDRPPGGDFAYANINFPIIAAAMEGATGERFDRLMHRLVFAPLGLDACYNWTMCSDAAVARAVTLYRPTGIVARDDLAGTRPACPVTPARDGSCDLSRYVLARNGAAFSPQGGLRISMRGLARLGQMWLRGGEGFLSPASLARLATAQPVSATPSAGGEGGEGSFFCGYGLATHRIGGAGRAAGCNDDLGRDGRARIGHSGDAYSLRSGLWLDPARRTGIAFFVSGLPEHDAPLGQSAFTAAEEAMARTALRARRQASGRVQ